MNFADEFMPSAKTVYPRQTVRTEVNGTERNGTERNGTERQKRDEKRNGTERNKKRNGMERNGNGNFFLMPTVHVHVMCNDIESFL